MNAPRIQDYAVIGDSRSTALVSRDGSIDWLCWPQFDSASLFAAVLDPSVGGSWRIAPVGAFRSRREYLEGSNVLVTTFEVPTGEVRVTDLMSVLSEEAKKHVLTPEHELIRLVECVRGTVELQVQFCPRPDYARQTPRLRDARALGIRLEHGSHLYTLRTDAHLEVHPDGVARGQLRLRAGERRHLSLTYDREGPAVLSPLGDHVREAMQRTTAWWRSWSSRCSYRGPYREQVIRSLLALKLLSFAPSGAIVAAPTTSLPERIRGGLNWDYRFCWVRDASLTVRALLDVGYADEATAFVSWLLHATRLTRPELRVLYDVYGELPKNEEILPHLRGHRGSQPVRIRNAAADQLQLDSYGEVIDAVVQMCRRGARLDRETQRMLRQFGQYVCENWQLPDHGIWEPRGSPKHHTHSRVLCWVALDRLLELHRMGAIERIPVDWFEKDRELIRQDVEEHGWSPHLRSYTQVLGEDSVDASLLLLSWYGFADARHPRMRGTFQRIQERLETSPGLLYRHEESHADSEGAFGICSFWAVEYLARGGGSLEEAEHCFEQLLSYGNDVGLYAEEIAPDTGEPLGNFPQAFTHVGLISAALAIEERRREEAEGKPASVPRWTEEHPPLEIQP
jgi:GH15 family glucan-1,4-alpha-glucosidase